MTLATDRDRQYRAMAMRGKNRRLYTHLLRLPPETQEWNSTFNEIEAITGFELPPSARLYRPWWANQSRNGNGHSHSQALAWGAAGWETAEVDMSAETRSR